eukprot:TRINITY_DN4036_c0_g1_i1.p1 TRINITY_DN4036_c0_g1~~TRINITY_DN4036_c0_g1_i1.p1  ORF type:complete len:103 (-),score=18.58 TRINITY_DN4036_c0_g1_i1:129-437(-)
MRTSSLPVRYSSMIGLYSETSMSLTFGFLPAIMAISQASSAVSPMFAGQLTPGQSDDTIESTSKETKILSPKVDNISSNCCATDDFLSLESGIMDVLSFPSK